MVIKIFVSQTCAKYAYGSNTNKHSPSLHVTVNNWKSTYDLEVLDLLLLLHFSVSPSPHECKIVCLFAIFWLPPNYD